MSWLMMLLGGLLADCALFSGSCLTSRWELSHQRIAVFLCQLQSLRFPAVSLIGEKFLGDGSFECDTDIPSVVLLLHLVNPTDTIHGSWCDHGSSVRVWICGNELHYTSADH